MKWACVHEARHDKNAHSSLLKLGTFLTALIPYDSLTATSRFDHENQIPAT